MYYIFGVLIAIFLFVLFLIVNAMTKKPKKIDLENIKLIEVDKNLVAKHLSEAVQHATVSMYGEYTDDKPFYAFHKFIDTTYPSFAKAANKTIIKKYSLVYYIEGSDKSLNPACFLSHQDVVPAPREGWEVDPFAGEIKDGFVYGRGAQDMKSQLVSTLEAIDMLLAKGIKPKRSIYCCFGHDEEPNTTIGAPSIVEYLKEKGVELEFVFDEGGAILDGSILGINKMLAMIGTCEKGYADIQLTAEEPGGHSSTPGRKTALGKLAKALIKLEKSPMPSRWTDPSRDMFDILAPHMKPVFKVLFANRKILSGLLKKVMTLVSPVTTALFRTTFAPTMAKGSSATNVLPPSASAIINCRILVGETAQQVKDHIQRVVGDDIKVEIISSNDPTPVSPTNTETYNKLEKSIMETFEGMIPSPFVFIAATDARYYTKICKNVYRFTPFEFSEDDRSRIHALNERCSIDALEKAVQFFVRFIENTCL